VADHCWQLESQRLSLQPFAPQDRDELLALFNHPGVRRYLLDDKLVSIKWVDEMIQKSLQLFASAGYGLWAARRKGLTDIIGFAGYGFFHEPPELQLLYGHHPANWGQGARD
jgi:[ribosomal protein S5]-alanine N-acetyltransferase